MKHSFTDPIPQSLIAACVLLMASGAPAVHASTVSLSPSPTLSGAGANWVNFGNVAFPGSPAFGFVDAGTSYGGDAFDDAGLISVDGTYYTNPDGDVDVTGQTLTTDLSAINGLTLSLQYTALSGSQTLRTLISMTNPGASTISSTISYQLNWGSDGSTLVRSTSSGDTTITTGDIWSVTSDSGDADPVNLTAFGGAGFLTPSSIATTVFNNAGSEGLALNYFLSFAPGETRYLVFYHDLFDTTSDALSAAAAIYNNPLTGERIAGLPSQGVANFAAVPEPTSAYLALFSVMPLLYRRRR